MTEEKKEAPAEAQQKPEPKAEEPKAQEPKAEVKAEAAPAQPQAASAPTAQAAPAAQLKEEKKAEAKPAKVKPENCAACNKSVRKKRWYYRNGKYYCTKRCWMTTLKKEEKPSEAASA
jgi:outer membrane biosynthesis protein TonB